MSPCNIVLNLCKEHRIKRRISGLFQRGSCLHGDDVGGIEGCRGKACDLSESKTMLCEGWLVDFNRFALRDIPGLRRRDAYGDQI